MSKNNITTVVRVVEDSATTESAKADRRKSKKTDAEASAILSEAFATKNPPVGEAHESGEE